MRFLLAVILVLALLAVGAFYSLQSDFFTGSSPEFSEPLLVSAEAAEAAEEKFRRLESDGEEVSLSDVELTSLFQLSPETWSIGVVSSPIVRMRGDTIALSGLIDPADLPSEPALDAVRMILPDATRVDVSGRIDDFDGTNAVIEITSVDVAGLPFPSRYFPVIVQRLGLQVINGIPDGSFVLPLPAGIRSARVEGGLLILTP